MTAKAVTMGARWRPDAVLASGIPYSFYAAAWAVGRSLRVPYVVDYHDPWTLDPLREADAFPPGHPVWSWEQRILHRAALVVTVNQPLVDWYRQRYPAIAGNVRLATLGFDETVLEDPGFTMLLERVHRCGLDLSAPFATIYRSRSIWTDGCWRERNASSAVPRWISTAIWVSSSGIPSPWRPA